MKYILQSERLKERWEIQCVWEKERERERFTWVVGFFHWSIYWRRTSHRYSEKGGNLIHIKNFVDQFKLNKDREKHFWQMEIFFAEMFQYQVPAHKIKIQQNIFLSLTYRSHWIGYHENIDPLFESLIFFLIEKFIENTKVINIFMFFEIHKTITKFILFLIGVFKKEVLV